MWLAYHPSSKLFLSSQFKHFPLLEGILPPRLLSHPCFVLGLLQKISPSILQGASVSMHCSCRVLLELQRGLQGAHPSRAGPQPTAPDAFNVSNNWGDDVPFHFTVPFFPADLHDPDELSSSAPHPALRVPTAATR